MEFRRGGTTNQRRRRVLKEDADGETPSALEPAAEPAPRRRRRSSALANRTYTDAALVENQPRITDLIPQRLWTLSVGVLSVLSAVALVLALYAHADRGARWLGDHNLVALDPTTRGSLSSWLSSAMLGLAAIGSVAVFSIRRHRIDDYKGRYRVWLALATVCLVASIDATTALHRVPQQTLHLVATRYAAGTSLGEYPGFWWVAFNLVAVVVVAARLSVEVRRSAGAAGWVVVAAASYLAAGALELGFFATPAPFVDVLLQAGAKLLADASLLFAIAAYARYVYLDSQGILAQRRAERLARKRAAAADREARRIAKAEARAAAQAAKEEQRAEAEQLKEEKRAAAASRRAAARSSAKATADATADATGDVTGASRDASTADKPKSEKTETGKPAAVKAEGSKADTGKTEFGKTDAGKTDAGKTATVKPAAAASPLLKPTTATTAAVNPAPAAAASGTAPNSANATNSTKGPSVSSGTSASTGSAASNAATAASAAGVASAASAASAAKGAAAESDDDADDEDADGDEQDGGMSRAERKRLKKLARRENRRAA